MQTLPKKIYPFIAFITLILTGCEGINFPSFISSNSASTPLSTSSETLAESSSLAVTTSTDATSDSFTASSSDVTSSSTNEDSASTSSTAAETSTSSTSSTASVPTSSSSSSTYTYSGYYSGLQGLSDTQLMSTLRPLLRQALGNDGLFPSSVTYETAITALQNSDKDPDPAKSNNIILWYRMTSVSKTWDSGSTWNREHVWPQSLLDVSTSNSSRHKGADAHNLKPANPSDNSSRGNKYFSETASSLSYSPPVSIRGDIARILFYMVTMYPELSLIDVTSGSPAKYKMAQFSLMVKWHLADPVDDFESRRNQILYQHQNNRNPFIDHEELVCRMFRNQTTAALNACQA